MAKNGGYVRNATTGEPRPDRRPLAERSYKVTTAPVRLSRNVAGQNRTGRGNPHR